MSAMYQADGPRLPKQVALPWPLRRLAGRALRAPLRRAFALSSVAVLLTVGAARASIPAADCTILGRYDKISDELCIIASSGAGRRAVEYGIRTDRGLSTQDRSLLMVWLNGESLLDPRLVLWVNAATMGHPVEGAGPMAQGSAVPPRP